MGRYIEVATELAIDGTLTYSVAQDDQPQVGARVVVTVSGRRHNGVIMSMSDTKPSYRVLSAKEIIDTPDNLMLGQKEIELWQWVAAYYMCTIGQVYKVAMPLSIRTNVYKYSTERYLKLASGVDPIKALDSLKRAPSQHKALLRFLELSEIHEFVLRAEMLKESSALAISELRKKGILEIDEMHQRLPALESRDTHLSKTQCEIADLITAQHAEKDIVLLHEKSVIDKFAILARMVEQVACSGGQTLILTPDGFSAEALYERFRDHFGANVVAYHPNMSDAKRCETFSRSRTEASVVVGARGAVFLPMDSLALVVVDQEHDFGYKNSDSSPRMNVRDVALMKAAKASAKVLLCSETPAVESYFNATRGAWGLVETPIANSDNISFKVLERGKELLSIYLRRRIEQTIEQGKQALIFQNRRGFSQWIECQNCFDTPKCSRCSVSLTFHKVDNTLRCHYCGYQEPYTGSCQKCGSTEISFQGRGTERIEESLQNLFPQAKIERIDYDSTRGRGAFGHIAASIATDCNIVVGTQMVVRGIDFSRVGLIGIVNADNMLSQSDFRSSERAHSLLTLLSNRVSHDGGEVIIQTTKRLDSVIRSVESQDQARFYESEIAQRSQMNYPPAVRMIRFMLTHKSREELIEAANRFESLLRPTFGNRISPPFEPSVERIQDHFLIESYLRIERERSVIKAKELVKTAIASLRQGYPSLTIYADVDPM